jgi:hypothetical protein
MQYDSLKRMPAGGLASFLTSNMDEIEDNVLAFGAPRGINSMVDVGNRMASMGRNGDDQLVHMRTGEIAVSPELLEENPRLAGELADAFDRSNVDMERYVVGSEANSINPMTGQPEFFLKKLVRGIKNVFKKIAPIIVPIGLNMLFPGLGTVASGALGAGITTLVQGGNFKDALKSAAFGGLMGGVSAGFGFGGPAGATTFSERAFGALGGMDTPIVRPGMFGTPDLPASASPVATAQDVTAGVETQAAAGSATPPAPDSQGILSRSLDTAKDFYGEYLSPNRGMPTQDAILAKAGEIQSTAAAKGIELTGAKAMEMATAELTPGMISRYAPLALAGTAAVAAAGGFETPEAEIGESPFGISSQELYDQNPGKYSVFAGYNMPTPMSPVSRPTETDDGGYIYQNYLQPQYAAQGGVMNRQGQRDMALQDFPRRDGFISGPGTETSDDVPAMLSDGEFVMTARAVRGLGNGSRKQGVKKMYDLMRAFEGGAVA